MVRSAFVLAAVTGAVTLDLCCFPGCDSRRCKEYDDPHHTPDYCVSRGGTWCPDEEVDLYPDRPTTPAVSTTPSATPTPPPTPPTTYDADELCSSYTSFLREEFKNPFQGGCFPPGDRGYRPGCGTQYATAVIGFLTFAVFVWSMFKEPCKEVKDMQDLEEETGIRPVGGQGAYCFVVFAERAELLYENGCLSKYSFKKAFWGSILAVRLFIIIAMAVQLIFFCLLDKDAKPVPVLFAFNILFLVTCVVTFHMAYYTSMLGHFILALTPKLYGKRDLQRDLEEKTARSDTKVGGMIFVSLLYVMIRIYVSGCTWPLWMFVPCMFALLVVLFVGARCAKANRQAWEADS